ncbi:TetR family transcriptional regulator [Rhizobium sp. RU36D]|uniref:TetR family transcriptional regulator n=1 Tax=Rhizobium sp. RU36D TaxID=1907415 RepID=UPI0009D872E5|nr:TetR family transcriptional regulator [Rhizobium sp. RU36D]SMD19747.1 transcriptional regulator, TetR family [Rhizobium sp. RU36D]
MIVDIDAEQDSVRQENIERILDSAERLFRHYGYAKTTVADIAKDLGMSTANIYRFFGSKSEIHQALANRMLSAGYALAQQIAALPVSAEERLRRYAKQQFQITVETMMDEQKVHEMVIVAIEQEWHVIDKHIDRLNALIAQMIADGIAAGEFTITDPDMAAKCFGASIVSICHPQLITQCINKSNRATPDALIEFAIRALKA